MAYIEEKLSTFVAGEYDVIVVGGGPAGVGAAIASARHGAKTLVIESNGYLGGMWTAGFVMPIWDADNKGGIVGEIVAGLKKDGGATQNGPAFCFDVESMKLLLDEMLEDAGAEVLFHTCFAKPITDGNAVKGVIVENKSGRSAYLSKCVIDCTGDGDVCARAGAEYKMGRDCDGAIQPMSELFKIGESDYVQAMDYGTYPTTELFFHMKHWAEKNGEKDYDFDFDRPYILPLPTPHEGVAEIVHIRNRSAVDAADLSAAETEGRKKVKETMDFFTRNMPQFKRAVLKATAPHIGVRESRRITGEYVVGIDDLINGQKHRDGVCLCAFNVDIHQPDGISQEGQEIPVKPYHIPYRALVPVKTDGVLTAGRCISGDYKAHASYRVTGTCVATGQAAGTAAAIAVKSGCLPRNIDTDKLVKTLLEDGVKL